MTHRHERIQITTGQDTSDSSVPTPPTDSMGYITVDHSASDDAIDQVEFTFRVSQARLDERGLSTDDVVLYRYSDGQWTALDTTFVETTADGSHRFRTTSPGLSAFTIGSSQAQQQTPTTTPPTTGTPTTTPDDGSPTDTPSEETSTDTPVSTDTPDEQGGPGILLIGGLVIVLLAIAGALYMMYGRD